MVKCKKCGYEWSTRSKLLMVSCPSCGTKNKTRELDGEQTNSPDASHVKPKKQFKFSG